MEINSVTYSVTKYLWEQIITGKLESGQKLNEIELASRIEISRPPLREAFRRLEYEKLVVSIPRKGTFVSHVSVEDCQELFHVRKVLECAAVDCLKMNQIEKLPEVKKTLSVVEKTQDILFADQNGQNILKYYKLMAAFHEKLVESCKNRWLIHSYSSLKGSLARYQIMYLNLPGSYQKSMEHHLAVLRMIEEGNFSAAKRSLQGHIESTSKRLNRKMIQAQKDRDMKNLLSGNGSF